MRADLGVENVLKGEAGGETLRYYYFSPPCGSTRNVSEGPREGAYRVVFLRRERGYWRAVADFWRDGIAVGSGGHAGMNFEGRPPNRAVAELLLTPGQIRSVEEFADSIPLAREVAVQLIGRAAVAELLRPLYLQGPLPVRAAACLATGVESEKQDCSAEILTAYGDRFERSDFTALTISLVLRLDFLASGARPRIAERAALWLPLARVAVGLPPAPRPVLASE
jgi:hypothetical protein